MYKKILVLLILIFISISPISAQSTEPSESGMMKVPNTGDSIDGLQLPVFGEDHAYSIIFRGNGEAVVNMRVGLSNFDDKPKKDIVLDISNGTLKDIAVFQIIREKRCVAYDNLINGYSDSRSQDLTKLKCLDYQEPDYYSSWWDKSSYLRAQASVDGQKIHITLPTAIESSKTGSYVLFFKINGLTKKVFGGANEYRFESLKSESPIRNLAIAVSTDSEMIFKGSTTQVVYQTDTSAPLVQTALSSKRAEFTSPEFDNYINQIGQGQIYKYSSNLSPGDTFIVEGSFAKSMISLYTKEALMILAILLGLFLVVVIGIYFVTKRSKDKENMIQKPQSHSKNAIIAFSASFISALIIAGYTMVVLFIAKYLENWSYMGSNNLNMLFLSIFSLGVYAVLIFVPALIAGFKRGVWWGVGVFSMTIFWVFLFILVTGGYYLLSSKSPEKNYNDTPVQMMRNDMKELPPPPFISPVLLQKTIDSEE